MDENNIYHIPNKSSLDENIFKLVESNGFELEKIVSYGLPLPSDGWFEDARAEWVTVIEGSAVIEFLGGHKIALTKGCQLIIKPFEKHRIANVSNPCVWLALKYDLPEDIDE